MELRIARDLIVGLRINMMFIRVPLIVPTGVYCDNQGVAKNTIVTKSTFNKKHKSIKYHVVCKKAAAEILYIGKEYTATNFADQLTKLMPYLRNNDLFRHIFYDY